MSPFQSKYMITKQWKATAALIKVAEPGTKTQGKAACGSQTGGLPHLTFSRPVDIPHS